MGSFNVSVVTLFDRSLEIIAAMERRMEREAAEGAQRVAARAAEHARRRTGEMADSFVVEGEGTERTVSNTSEHFRFNELGTRKMAAQPMLGPAGREEEGPFKATTAKAVEEVTAL